MINNTLTSSIYGALSKPKSSSLLGGGAPMSLTSQVKPKTTSQPSAGNAFQKPLVNLTGGASPSSLFNNPLSSPAMSSLKAPSLAAQTGLLNPPQANTGNAFSMSNLSQTRPNNSSGIIPTANAETTDDLQGRINSIKSGIDQIVNSNSNNNSTATQGASTNNPSPTNPPQSSGNNTGVRGLFPDVISSLMKSAQTGTTQVQNASDELSKYRQSVAQKEADITATGADLNFKTGELGALQKLSAIGENTRQQSVSNALTAQGNSIGALSSAAGLTQPQVTQFGQTSFNPLTGSFAGGNNGGLPDNVMQQYATMAANGQYSAIPSSITSNPVLSAQLNEAAKKLNPNFNPINSTALGSTNADIISKATSDVSNMQTNLSAADTNLAQLTKLAQENGINDLTSVTANKISNLFKGEFSNQALYSFNALLGGTRALYAAVLESRANLAPTDAYAIANTQVPDNVNLGALKDLTTTLKSEASNIIGAKQSQIQGAQSNNAGGAQTSAQGGSDSTTIGGTTFKLVNGQWVVA